MDLMVSSGLDGLNLDEPADESVFNVAAPLAPHKQWLRPAATTKEAVEIELKDRGLVDGRFVVRCTTRDVDEVSLIISYAFKQKLFHHVLERRRGEPWILDREELPYFGPLLGVIKFLQGRKAQKFMCELEQDVGDIGPARGLTLGRPKRLEKLVERTPRPMSLLNSPGLGVRKAVVKPPIRSNIGKFNGRPLSQIPRVKLTEAADSGKVSEWLISIGLVHLVQSFSKAKVDGSKLWKFDDKKIRSKVKNEDDIVLFSRALKQAIAYAATTPIDIIEELKEVDKESVKNATPWRSSGIPRSKEATGKSTEDSELAC